MRVIDLKLANVRSIETGELHFRPGFNLLVGDNGVGKTSVLEVLADCLEGYVQGLQSHEEVEAAVRR